MEWTDPLEPRVILRYEIPGVGEPDRPAFDVVAALLKGQHGMLGSRLMSPHGPATSVNADVRLIREGVEIYKGKISSLKRFKDDAREVEERFECGSGLDAFHDIKVGDTIEAYETRELAKKLDGGRDAGNKAATN